MALEIQENHIDDSALLSGEMSVDLSEIILTIRVNGIRKISVDNAKARYIIASAIVEDNKRETGTVTLKRGEV